MLFYKQQGKQTGQKLTTRFFFARFSFFKELEKMEYAILDDLMETAEERAANCKDIKKILYIPQIEELTEPFTGSAPYTHAYIMKNYLTQNLSPLDLLIIIRDIPTGRKTQGDIRINNVEQSIYPLYLVKDDGIELPPPSEIPKLHPEQIEFIVEHRKRPKQGYGDKEEFNPDIHRWTIDQIAKELNMSNRTVSKFCRAKNL